MGHIKIILASLGLQLFRNNLQLLKRRLNHRFDFPSFISLGFLLEVKREFPKRPEHIQITGLVSWSAVEDFQIQLALECISTLADVSLLLRKKHFCFRAKQLVLISICKPTASLGKLRMSYRLHVKDINCLGMLSMGDRLGKSHRNSMLYRREDFV